VHSKVLNGRTSDGGYGSDIVWTDCDFDNHGGAATFVNHMGEVLTWRDCRFHSSGPHPGLLITWRAGHWNVSAPSGRNLTTGVSVTVYRLFGGELTGDFVFISVVFIFALCFVLFHSVFLYILCCLGGIGWFTLVYRPNIVCRLRYLTKS
jgi:hypothetical protein